MYKELKGNMKNTIKPINYAEDYHEMKPSLFRESENLDRLLQALFDVCDVQQRGFLWLSENLLNVDVAQGFHLDFIGGIVGQPRFLSDFNTEPYFGFDKSYQSKTFGSALDPEVGGYWNSRSYFNTATSRQLNDDEYRRLIKARSIYNQSNCSANDLLEVVNLITNSKNNTVQMLRHGLIQINSDDQTGILSYFVDRLLNEDNILPIAAGVRVGLEEVVRNSDGEDSDGEDSDEVSYVNLDIPLFDSKPCENTSLMVGFAPARDKLSKGTKFGRYRVNGGDWIDYESSESAPDDTTHFYRYFSSITIDGEPIILMDGGDGKTPYPFRNFGGINGVAGGGVGEFWYGEKDIIKKKSTTIDFEITKGDDSDLNYMAFFEDSTAHSCAYVTWEIW